MAEFVEQRMEEMIPEVKYRKLKIIPVNSVADPDSGHCPFSPPGSGIRIRVELSF
jgi:hypothetical protein